MEAKVISKQDIAPWLNSVAATRQVIGPVTKDGVTKFAPVDDPSTIDLDAAGRTRSLREVFTPETETLFEYKITGLNAEVKDSSSDVPSRLVFGARACDAASLRYVDAVYSMVEPRDEPYFRRRERTAIAGVFCVNPAWSCFCTEVNDFLANPIEMDLSFTDIGDRYYVEAFTPVGEELAGAEQFTPATDEDASAVQAVREKTLAQLPAKASHETECLNYDWSHPVWAKLADKCMGCGICAYSCPTCHCFDIMERSTGSCGSRYRCWDTCQFEKFTLMGAGHNPRPSRTERTRQRVFHKFKYSVERYGMLGCVGCGRCTAGCPVAIDIRQVVNELEGK